MTAWWSRRAHGGRSVAYCRSLVECLDTSAFDKSGLDAKKFSERANLVRILHDDGSMGVYAHLKENLDLAVERVNLLERLSFNGQGEPDAATQWQLFSLLGASLRNEAKAL